MDIRAKLEELERVYESLNRELSQPELLKDLKRYRELVRSHAELGVIVGKFKEYRALEKEIKEIRQLQKEDHEEEMENFLEEELAQAQQKLGSLEDELRYLLLPKDPRDEKNVIMEIRAGAGGEEASLFAGDLYRMYTRYADSQGWKVEPLSSSPSDLGGFKEVVFSIKGKGAYSKMKYESGVHRVQRIPVTESGGRIHTSTATVAVLPEAEEIDVEINPNDLRIDVFRSTGPGGQSVNTTDSAVRITHIPTNLVVTCQDEKSQLQNREKALRILRARLLKMQQDRQQQEQAAERRSQVGTGDRSERIRTYNFPQGRLTDHRIGLTLYRLEDILQGDLDEIIDALATQERTEKLKELTIS